jgi:hypothetical protein
MRVRIRAGRVLAGVLALGLLGATVPTVTAGAAPSAFSILVPRAAPGSPADIEHSKWRRVGQTYRTNVAWRAPEDLGGFEDVTYEAEVERDGEIILELQMENAALILRKLVKGQTYTVCVYAVNEDGRSAPAEIVLQVPGRIPSDDGGNFDPGELAGPRPKITAVTPKQGGAGSFVRITGEHLDNLRYVRFGTRLAGFFIDSSGTLVATAPGGSGTVDIEVATAGGVAKATKAFNYGSRAARTAMKYGGR